MERLGNLVLEKEDSNIMEWKRSLFCLSVLFLFFLWMNNAFLIKVFADPLDIVVENNGDISWNTKATKARTNTIWEMQGFNILLEETEYGYPFGSDNSNKKLHIKIDVREDKVKIINMTPNTPPGGVLILKRIIPWKVLKKKIKENERFYKEIIKKVRKDGKATLYINGYFETMVKEENPYIKSILSNEGSEEYHQKVKNGILVYNGNKYVLIENEVFRLRKRNLLNVKQIENAEPWIVKSEWRDRANKHYNYPVKITIARNFLIKLVDKTGNIIGDEVRKESEKNKIKKFLKKHPHFVSKKEDDELLKIEDFKKVRFLENGKLGRARFSLGTGIREKGFKKFGFEEEEKRNKLRVNFKLPKKIFDKKSKKIYELTACYILDKEKNKKYKANEKGSSNEDANYLHFNVKLGLDTEVYYGEYVLTNDTYEEDDDLMEDEGEANPYGKIGSGMIEDSPFEVEDGIPVIESCYRNIRVENYILNYRFIKKSGLKTYNARSRIKWHLSWVETVGSGKKVRRVARSKTVTKHYNTKVKRKYSYWLIDRLEFYTLDSGIIENMVLPNSKKIMTTNQFRGEKLDFIHSVEEGAHIRMPRELKSEIDLGGRSAIGRSVPFYQPDSEVNAIVGENRVKNDSLSIDGRIYMSSEERETNTEKPLSPPTTGNFCEEKVLYDFGHFILSHTKNGIYESSGRVKFLLSKSVNPENGRELWLPIPDINYVRVHTPVICDFLLEDSKEWCQLVNPKLELYQFVLTKDFSLDVFSRGSHLGIKGYGFRDYEKYTRKKEVIFPFDVMTNGSFCPAFLPIEINRKMIFTIPSYVKEGIYSVKMKSYALNSFGEERKLENYANISFMNYVAENEFIVEVSGRLIDFKLENIKNSSLWEEVFKKNGGFALNHLPLINGNHPFYKNIGDFKKGYSLQFGVTTIGEYGKERYGVQADLSFFVYDENYQNRIPVDLYYEAVSEINGTPLGLVKVGSKADKENLHFYGVEHGKIPIFTYHKILMPNEMMKENGAANIQRWRGEYCLPARLYVCRKGVNIEKELQKRTGFLFDEDFWLKKGKLVVKADIYSLKDKKKELSYINEENVKYGHLNNWEYETVGRRKFLGGNSLFFKDGEVFVFDLKKSIWLERLAEVYKGW